MDADRFPDTLIVSPNDDGTEWTLVRPFRWRGSGDAVKIPAGFRTDFASIPRALWWLYPPAGRWARAAVVHDYLYRTGERSRPEADAIFLEAMRVLRVPTARRWVMYLAVRLCGGPAWRENRKAQEREGERNGDQAPDAGGHQGGAHRGS